MKLNECFVGDCRDGMRQMLAAGVKVQTCVTSPPYFGLRDYGHEGQLGLEETPDEFIVRMVEVFNLVRELLADDGVLWLNMGDSYAGSWGAEGRSTSHGNSAYNASVSSRNQITNHQKKSRRLAQMQGTTIKAKDLYGIPWMLAFALRSCGWYLRQDIIWHKPNPMPESVRDRCTKAHEYVFLFSKSERYFYDFEAMQEPVSENTKPRRSNNGVGFGHGSDASAGGSREGRGRVRKLEDANSRTKNNDSFDQAMAVMPEKRNRRSVWTIATEAYSGAHFATFPRGLVEPCILAGSRPGDTVFDPFMGSGTVAQVAQQLGRNWLGCELNPEYVKLQQERTKQLGMELSA